MTNWAQLLTAITVATNVGGAILLLYSTTEVILYCPIINVNRAKIYMWYGGIHLNYKMCTSSICFIQKKQLQLDNITYMTNAYTIKNTINVRIQSNTIFTSPTNVMLLFANGAIIIQVDIPIEVDIPKIKPIFIIQLQLIRVWSWD